MMLRKQIYIDRPDYVDARIVAKHQHRSFSSYVVHCVRIETRRQLSKAMDAMTAREALPTQEHP